jgi:hypothetical protein
MPKRAITLCFAAASLALAIAACGKGSTTTPPTPTPGPSATPNPHIRIARVSVTVNSTPQPNVPVLESTPRPTAACKANYQSCRPGKTIDTQTTDQTGEALFRKLDPKQTYCWKAELGSGATASACADWTVWQSGTVNIAPY